MTLSTVIIAGCHVAKLQHAAFHGATVTQFWRYHNAKWRRLANRHAHKFCIPRIAPPAVFAGSRALAQAGFAWPQVVAPIRTCQDYRSTARKNTDRTYGFTFYQRCWPGGGHG